VTSEHSNVVTIGATSKLSIEKALVCTIWHALYELSITMKHTTIMSDNIFIHRFSFSYRSGLPRSDVNDSRLFLLLYFTQEGYENK
jgi:hypothetical protein